MESSSKSYNIIISNNHDNKEIQLKDILFGDVFFCGGQSNMEQTV